MTDNSTITDMGLPSFVRQLREVDDMENLVACFDLWAPTVTGYAPLDHDLGRQHCRAALAYSHSIGTANFPLYVVMAFIVPEEPAGDARWAAWNHGSSSSRLPDTPPGGPTTGPTDSPTPGSVAGAAAMRESTGPTATSAEPSSLTKSSSSSA